MSTLARRPRSVAEEPDAMASSQSEQEGVEAMLGLGLVAGAGEPADDPAPWQGKRRMTGR